MTRAIAMLAAAGVSVAVVASPPQAPAGPAPFKACVACHGTGGGGNALGPDIRAIIGRPAASGEDYAYSGALKRSQIVWTEARLAAFLLKPQAVVPGTRMAYPGAGSPDKAAALAAYVAILR